MIWTRACNPICPSFGLRDSASAQAVKVRHLLTHVGGWTGDVFTDTGNNDDAAKLYVESMAEFEQLAPLGTIFSYNNAAFAVAGRVIETVTGMRYEDAAREQIFEPLGMESSSFFPHEVMLHRFAVGHQVADEAGKSETKVVRPWAIPRALNAAGGICCHVGDLLRYGAYHLGEGPPLLRADSLRQMHSPQVTINAYVGAVGLAWIISDAGGPRRLWHTGGTNGQNAILTLVPERGLALAMMANGTTGGIINDRYNKWVLREFCGIELPEPTAIDSTPDALAQYEGVYKGTMKEIALRMEEGELIAAIESERGFPTDAQLDTPPPAPIARCGEDELLVRAGQYQGSRVDVIRDESNAIRYLRFGSRLHVKQAADT